jgi:heptosyltransferase-2
LKGVSSGGLQGTLFRNSSERDSPRIELPRFLLEEAEPELSGGGWGIPELGPIVVRVPNWVGDVAMAYPSLAALRRCTQGIRLVGVAHERVASLLENVALVDELVVLNNQMGLGLLRTALALRRSRFTLGIAMPDSFSSVFLLWLGGVKRIVGFRAEMRDVFLSARLSRKKWIHLSEQYAQLLPRACKIDGRFVLTPGPRDMSRARRLLEGVGISESSPLALVAPGASYGETKRWPEESYTRLVELLKLKAESQVVLVGSAADKELCARIAEKSGCSTANLSGQTTLRDLAAIASIASVFVGNDSGAAHVAAAAGCPVVAIFGSSDPSWTAPRGEDVRVVYKKLSCSPCFLKECPYELQCLSQIEAGEVSRAVVEVTKQERLDKHGGNR